MARAALREDALRPGAAGPRLPPGARRRSAPTASARSSRRRSATCCATCAIRTAASTRPRTPTRPTSTATVTKACSTRGRRTRSAPRSTDGRTRTSAPCSSGSASPTSGNFEGRSIPNRLDHRGELAPAADDRGRPAAAVRGRAQRRPRPGLDDKVLTEWNALFLSALAEAAAAFQRDDWIAGRGRQRRVPAPRAARRTRPLAPLVAGRRHAAGTARRRSPPTTPRSCTRSSASAS